MCIEGDPPGDRCVRLNFQTLNVTQSHSRPVDWAILTAWPVYFPPGDGWTGKPINQNVVGESGTGERGGDGWMIQVFSGIGLRWPDKSAIATAVACLCFLCVRYGARNFT